MSKDHFESGKLAIQECLKRVGVEPEDYTDLIRALFLAAPKDREIHGVSKWSREGYPLSNAMISRVFNDIRIHVEDRGPVYVVWVIKEPGDRIGLNEVLAFEEVPWGEF